MLQEYLMSRGYIEKVEFLIWKNRLEQESE